MALNICGLNSSSVSEDWQATMIELGKPSPALHVSLLKMLQSLLSILNFDSHGKKKG
jgi:hypothetical protein